MDMSVWPLRYRHGHKTVEAFRWTDDDTQREEPQWAVDALSLGTMRIERGSCSGVRLLVMTPSGWTIAKPGDWIVRLAIAGNRGLYRYPIQEALRGRPTPGQADRQGLSRPPTPHADLVAKEQASGAASLSAPWYASSGF